MFDPWAKKIPHAVEQLSPCATTIEPVLSRVQTFEEDRCGDLIAGSSWAFTQPLRAKPQCPYL